MNKEFLIDNRVAKALRDLGLISENHDTSNMTHMEATSIIINQSSLNNIEIYGDFSGSINNSDKVVLAEFGCLDHMLEELLMLEHNYKV